MADIDFDICSEFPFTRTSVREAVRSNIGGNVRVRQKHHRPTRRFVLTFPRATSQLLDVLSRKWDEARGPILPMNYTASGEAADVEVQFAFPTFEQTVRSTVHGEMSVELVEVR